MIRDIVKRICFYNFGNSLFRDCPTCTDNDCYVGKKTHNTYGHLVQRLSVAIQRENAASVAIQRENAASVAIQRENAASVAIQRENAASVAIQRENAASVAIQRENAASVAIQRENAASVLGTMSVQVEEKDYPFGPFYSFDPF